MADPTIAPGFYGRLRASVLTETIGSTISTLSDTGITLAQNTAAAQPVLRQDANGRKYLEFDGVDDFMSTAAATYLNSKPGASAYVVAQMRTAETTGFSYFFSCSTGAATGSVRFAIRVDPDDLSIGGRRLDSDGVQLYGSGIALPTDSVVALTSIGDYNETLPGNDIEGYTNGTSVVSNLGYHVTGLISNTNPLGLAIGSSAAGSAFLHMNFYELLLYEAAHTQSERASVHSYIQDTYAVTMSDYVASTVTTRPVSTILSTGWTFTGATSHHEAVNEVTPSTAEYVEGTAV